VKNRAGSRQLERRSSSARRKLLSAVRGTALVDPEDMYGTPLPAHDIFGHVTKERYRGSPREATRPRAARASRAAARKSSAPYPRSLGCLDFDSPEVHRALARPPSPVQPRCCRLILTTERIRSTSRASKASSAVRSDQLSSTSSLRTKASGPPCSREAPVHRRSGKITDREVEITGMRTSAIRSC
jgi:hypothetical protein